MELRELYGRLAAGKITEEEAERLDHRHRPPEPRKHVGSRPRKPEHVERRRRWAAAGKMPPRIACRFTAAEQAVLAAVAAEVQRRGDCRKSNDELADIAGVSISTAKNALREARALGLIVCEERRGGRWFNLPNVVKITAAEWRSWLRLRHGVKLAAAIDTKIIQKGSSGGHQSQSRAFHRLPERGYSSRNGEDGSGPCQDRTSHPSTTLRNDAGGHSSIGTTQPQPASYRRR